ncbi:MvaI/BcnI family restriction endonuclease, partial [Providencia stuartii]
MSQYPRITSSQLKKLKNQAKKIKKEKNIPHADALEVVARSNGFGNWKAVVKACDTDASIKTPTPNISQTFIDDPDVILDDDDQQLVQQERAEDIDEATKLRVNNNKKVLTQLAIEFSIFEPTKTGLKKSILDATQVVRTHFEITNFHHYELQGQGANEYGIKKTAFLLTSEKRIPTTVSLYRPKTKKGDPRMWFSGLPNFTFAGAQIAIVIHNDCAYLIDLSSVNLTLELESTTSQLKKFVDSYLSENNAIANELLNKLKELAKAPIKATHVGDTAVGMSIEDALGIQANSSKLPDYKGIELKSGRNAEKNRTTIFAQVAEWEISPYKKSADILDRFGYFREN